nr:50S ribosomal protein L32 [Akkermansia muciniphila]
MARAEAPQVQNCGSSTPGHTACPNCGTYTTRSGKEIVVKAEA